MFVPCVKDQVIKPNTEASTITLRLKEKQNSPRLRDRRITCYAELVRAVSTKKRSLNITRREHYICDRKLLGNELYNGCEADGTCNLAKTILHHQQIPYSFRNKHILLLISNYTYFVNLTCYGLSTRLKTCNIHVCVAFCMCKVI